MKTGKGVVKKYSREYNRTLKNGEKKKNIMLKHYNKLQKKTDTNHNT